ncbi:MAG: hypothetical protein RIK87_23015 [Fuerstiella sp.]
MSIRNSSLRALTTAAWLAFVALFGAVAADDGNLVAEKFRWNASAPLVKSREAGGFPWHAIKDPSIVRH